MFYDYYSIIPTYKILATFIYGATAQMADKRYLEVWVSAVESAAKLLSDTKIGYENISDSQAMDAIYPVWEDMVQKQLFSVNPPSARYWQGKNREEKTELLNSRKFHPTLGEFLLQVKKYLLATEDLQIIINHISR